MGLNSTWTIYEISPPPTRILLDLIARQTDSKNDELYRAMRAYNPSTAQITSSPVEALGEVNKEDVPQRVRNLFEVGLLKAAQLSAKKLIER